MEDTKKRANISFLSANWQIFRLQLPAIMSCLGIRIVDFVNVIYSTRLGDPTKVIALAMANIMTDSIQFVWMTGMNCALETLVSQAHGAGKLGLCGAIYKRAWAINSAIAAPLIIILLYSEQILKAFGQSDDVSKQAQVYVLLSIPQAYMLGMYDLTKLYLGCFESTMPAMLLQSIVSVLHLAWLQYLVFDREFGLNGIAMASSITASTMFLLTLAYARFIHPETRESFI